MASIADILTAHKDREGPLLPILHDVQKAFGHVNEDAMREIAGALNLTRAEVYGVVSFYHDFRKEAEARPVLKLCRAEACKARGVEALVPIAESQNRIKVEAIYCLGLCAVGPSAMVGDKVYARLDGAKFKTILEAM
ncbi:NAD(P)H-dependent oxidoreductase subunit E [Sphingorhabdus sp. EL138]|uniref:NAD(P)H-dependent oxidoreductase subunit E n=1 Tax=Sphingorhabdus sp. EL138 TaxID=2073156 RepID=UPI0025F07C5A|nr:NAD(P)H-dependent oxidoreductase subunit E [Sphingorhabdus sp. EL138]